MKKLKKLTFRQKKLLIDNGYDVVGWYLERQNDKEHTYTFVNKDTKSKLVLKYK